MISKLLAAVAIAAAGLFAGLFAGVAAPASASCAPGLTSIPCTIADNVSTAPARLAGQGCDQPTNGNPSGNASTCGLASITNLAGVGCPPGSADASGNSPSGEPCGLPAVPGQFVAGVAGIPGNFVAGVAGLPVQAALGANQIATAPQTIAGALAAAPGQFVGAINNGGTAP